MHLIRNPDYRGLFSGNLQEILFTLFSDSTDVALYSGYEQNLFDIIWVDRTVEQSRRLRLRLAGECISAPGPATVIIVFNIDKPPFNDRRVRQAFAHSVDRYTLANVILRGSAFPATGGFVPQGIPGHSPGIGLSYNPDLARGLLAEAGYPGGKDFPVIHSLTSTGGGSSFTDYLTSAWQTILGINLQSEEVAWVLFDKRRLEIEPHLYRIAWLADYPDPDSFLRVGVASYYSQVWNDEYDRLVNNARQINDHERRLKMYQSADLILVQEAVVIPLVYGLWELMVKPWVKKYPISPTKTWFFKDVIIEPH